MKKYIKKKISDVQPIPGYNQVESVLFSENGYKDQKKIDELFPDLKSKSWLTKFISEFTQIGRGREFVDLVSKNKGEHFCVIGDYDADGIMATTIMKLALTTYGVSKCDYIIPDRLNDGYGIKNKHVDRAVEMGAKVIVTVDNGVTANEAIGYAKSKGLVVIVTDHHIPDENNLPNADLIVNPHVTKDKMEEICGAFVALKLARELLDVKIREHEYVLKDMGLFAAVATISDVMPIIGENRLLVKYVLDNINFVKEKNLWVGRTLKFISGFSNVRMIKDENQIITEDTLGFYVGPTINASGRVNGETEHIVDDIINAVNFNVFINGYAEVNRERKNKTQEIFKEHIHSKDPIGFLIIDKDKYDYPIGGLIGLVANRIADKERKPALVGTEKDGKMSFSCRSVPGYSLYEGLDRFFKKHPNSSVEGGGHDGAIGIRTSSKEDINLLKEHFIEDYQKYSTVKEEKVYLFEDEYLQDIFYSHRRLAPFGKSFERLKFIHEGIIKHVDSKGYLIQVDGIVLKSFSKDYFEKKVGTKVRVIFSVSLDNKAFDDLKIEEMEEIQ